MSNELILIISLVAIFGGTLIAHALFGEHGLLCWSVVATIAANIEVLILVDAFGMTMTLGNVLFASTFLTTDILSELYGKKSANRAVNLSIFASVCFIIISQSWFLYTPNAEDFVTPGIYTVFSNTPRLVLASIVVFAIVQRFDVWAYHAVWRLTEKKTGSTKKGLFLRNNASTLVSQLLNTVLFNLAAFAGIYPAGTVVSIIISSYVIYIVTSIADTPFIYLARALHGKKRAV